MRGSNRWLIVVGLLLGMSGGLSAQTSWVYRASDGLLCVGETCDPAQHVTNPAAYPLVTVSTPTPPDPRTQRAANATTLRAATAAERAAYDAAVLDRVATTALEARFQAAYTWVLLKRLFPLDTNAQTKTKMGVLHGDVLTAFRTQPWR